MDETIPFTGTIDSNLSGFTKVSTASHSQKLLITIYQVSSMLKHATEVRYKSVEQRRIVLLPKK